MSGSPRPRRIVGASLKMYFDLPQTLAYIHSIADLSTHAASVDVDLFVVPDFISLHQASQILSSTPVLLSAQDTFWEDSGAYTGEVSPVTLQQVGVKMVVVGHAERRRLFGETNEHVARKAAAVVRNGMVPLVCIGEKSRPGSIASAAVGMAVEECRPQVMAVLKAIPDDAKLILAYEPVWAIGAEEPAGADYVVAVTQEVRRMAEGRSGRVRLFYGGSAGPGTFGKLVEAVDGLFLGSFAHDAGNLREVLKEVGEA